MMHRPAGQRGKSGGVNNENGKWKFMRQSTSSEGYVCVPNFNIKCIQTQTFFVNALFYDIKAMQNLLWGTMMGAFIQKLMVRY